MNEGKMRTFYFLVCGTGSGVWEAASRMAPVMSPGVRVLV